MRGEVLNEQQYRNAFDKFQTYQLELPCKVLKQIAFITRPKIEENVLIFMDRSSHEDYLSQPLKTNSKQFLKAIPSLTAFNGIFNVTNSNNKTLFRKINY